MRCRFVPHFVMQRVRYMTDSQDQTFRHLRPISLQRLGRSKNKLASVIPHISSNWDRIARRCSPEMIIFASRQSGFFTAPIRVRSRVLPKITKRLLCAAILRSMCGGSIAAGNFAVASDPPEKVLSRSRRYRPASSQSGRIGPAMLPASCLLSHHGSRTQTTASGLAVGLLAPFCSPQPSLSSSATAKKRATSGLSVQSSSRVGAP